MHVLLTWLFSTAFVLVALSALGFALRELLHLLYFWRHRARLTLAAAASNSAESSAATSAATAIERDIPWVTVQLPLFNEPTSAARLLRHIAALDYPADRLEIQILDDSTDETSQVVSATISALKSEAALAEPHNGARPRELPAMIHLRRGHREGFKAGALRDGLASARGEFIAIFDADFRPKPDFLRAAVAENACWKDPRVAFVQARWTFGINTQSRFLRAQALLIQRHFALFKSVRQDFGGVVFFNGSGGVWRRSAILASGNWQGDTLCEDLDLSYRAAAQGYHGLYLPHLEVENDLPPDIQAFRLQQSRWARGTTQNIRKLTPIIAALPRPLWSRIDEVLEISGYLIHPVMLALLLLWPWAVLFVPTQVFWPAQALAGIASMVSPIGFWWAARESGRRANAQLLLDLLFATFIGFGLVLLSSLAAWRGFFSRGTGVFARTPKRAGEAHASQGLMLGEFSLGLYALASLAALVLAGQWMWLTPCVLWATCLLATVKLQLRLPSPRKALSSP